MDTCVISADSRQFYKELSIGTAKPTKDEMNGVKHYFVGSISIQSDLSASRFEKEALQVLEEEFKHHDYVILVGGSGLFIDAVCKGFDDIPFSQKIRDDLNLEFEENGLQPLLEELKTKDHEFYKFVDRQNPMRVIRAVEIIRNTGKKVSEMHRGRAKERYFKIHTYIIDHDREQLYERINLRVDQMIESGLLDEVKNLIPYRAKNALNTVGYKELFGYLDGNISLDEAIDLIKQNTRRYAKRQLTWFRKNPNAQWLSFKDKNLLTEEILSELLNEQRKANLE